MVRDYEDSIGKGPGMRDYSSSWRGCAPEESEEVSPRESHDLFIAIKQETNEYFNSLGINPEPTDSSQCHPVSNPEQTPG